MRQCISASLLASSLTQPVPQVSHLHDRVEACKPGGSPVSCVSVHTVICDSVALSLCALFLRLKHKT